MSKKPKPRRSAKSREAPQKPPLLKSVVSRFMRLFEEELPVTEYHGNGKCQCEVDQVGLHQAALEAICGGRTSQKQKVPAVALLSPEKTGDAVRVSISGRTIGRLKKADAKLLQRQLAKAGMWPCSIKVAALIVGGRKKKNGATEDFTVGLCLPPKPTKPAKPPGDNPVD
jgi:hypothetical protein